MKVKLRIINKLWFFIKDAASEQCGVVIGPFRCHQAVGEMICGVDALWIKLGVKLVFKVAADNAVVHVEREWANVCYAVLRVVVEV